MKKIIRNFLIFATLISATSCHHQYTKNEQILLAESILFENPDSAFSILNNINIKALKNKADYAAWCLYYTHAQYKTNKEVSDSLLNIAENYYTNSKFPEQEGTVYYLYGCIAESNDEHEIAISWYKKADQKLKQTNAYHLSGLVNHNMSYIFSLNDHYKRALNRLQKARQYFDLSEKKKYQANVFRDIGRMFYLNGYPNDSVAFYMDRGAQLANEVGDSLNHLSILAMKGEMLHIDDPISSKNMILNYIRYEPKEQYRYNAFLAYIYCSLNQMDSALYYFNINKSDLNTTKLRFLNNVAGMAVEKYRKNYQKALDYSITALQEKDSLFKQNMETRIYTIDKEFDYTAKDKENLILKISNRNRIIWIFSLTIFVLVIVIIASSVIYMNRKSIMIKEHEHQQLESNLQILKETHEQKKQFLLNKLQNRTQNTLYLKKLEMGLKDEKKIEEFKDKITQQSIISEKDWMEFIQEADHFLDEKISHLAMKFPTLKENDMKIIILICLNYDITDCCTLLDTQKNTLYHRRVLIKERLNLEKSTDLNQWLMEYIKST